MSGRLLVLPAHSAPAAENMAFDWLMLEDFPHPDSPRLRHYGWTQPSATFGYAQSWDAARASVPAQTPLIRRPTGGGLVHHGNDWTYALVLPANHPLAKAPSTESYCAIHKALQRALTTFGATAKLAASKDNASRPGAKPFQICFNNPVTSDVMRDDGRKIAGAAQRRNRNGLLIQGTLDCSAAPEVRDWDKFATHFAKILAETIDAIPEPCDTKLRDSSSLTHETTRFASDEWNQRR